MALEVTLSYTPVVNFAMQQNHAPVLREIRLLNASEKELRDLDICMAFEPAFAYGYTAHLETIAPGCEECISPLPVVFSTAFLSNLTERVEGVIRLTVRTGDEELAQQEHPIAVLAFNEWGGSNVLPEMLAAFATPNHPEVSRLIKRASEILGQWTGSPSLDEYQTRDPNRVKKQMAALYQAIWEKEIAYSTLPASFEASGQRIRLVEELIANKLGTCLDMTMLYVGCLEAMGIHPLVVFHKGHSYAGGWLVMDSFADSINDDPALLTKRMADGINEILLVETTCMNAGSHTSFDVACTTAERRLDQSDFLFFVDIFRARIAHIRPLPQRVPEEGGWKLVEDKMAELSYAAPRDLSATDIIIDSQTTVDKKVIWERKLLDLSLRNNLLNTRLTQDTIPVISVNVAELEDALADNQDFQVCPKPTDWENDALSAGVYKAINAGDPVFDLVREELAQHRIRTYLSEERLKNALKHLYRASRTIMEENGANTLYLAIGLLKWYETPSSTKPRYAPILLFPVEIIRKSSSNGYIIRSRDEETMLNITLLEMLRQAFNITIGGLNPLPQDGKGVDVSLIFNTIRRKVMEQRGWDVIEQAILGSFSFNKFILWNDIHNNSDILCQNKLVSSLVSGRVDESVNEGLPAEEELEEQLDDGEILLPLSADSSQMAAIDAALSGKSFILHGPPGTGKSQTITNIIANALYQGKRVLFVAEKMAALEVVQNRLESIGLGPFCLELHSNKAKKSAVLEQLRRTTEVTKMQSPEAFAEEARQINAARKELNGHIQSLHREYPAGVSFYDCAARLSALDEALPAFTFPIQDMPGLTKSRLDAVRNALAAYSAACRVTGNPAESPLKEIRVADYTPDVVQAFQDLPSLEQRCADLAVKTKSLLDAVFGQEAHPLKRTDYAKLSETVEILLQAGAADAPLFRIGDEETVSRLEEACRHGMARDSARKIVCQQYDDSILGLDATSFDKEWRSTLTKWFLPKALGQNALLKRLRTYSRTDKKPEKDAVLPLLQEIAAYQAESSQVSTLSNGRLAGIIRDRGEAWPAILEACVLVHQVNQRLSALFPGRENPVSESIATSLASGMQQWKDYPTLYHAAAAASSSVEKRLEASFATAGDGWAENVSSTCQRWRDAAGQLRSRILYNQKRNAVAELGFVFITDQVEAGAVPPEDMAASFDKGFFRTYAEYILTQEKDLVLFHGGMFEETVSRFRDLCTEWEALTREEIRARLSARLPALQKEASQSSEVGILQRNIRNGCRGISLRRLFDMIPDLLPRVSPCMLMSPLSVAQYIDPRAEKFDLVVFDEASQMPTCEAVGAISRGNSIVVVGDPKQMPPTNFFVTSTFDEDNPDLEDLESILDDCLALSFPSKHLRWHYRSKHESLIAFSNNKYYENKLLTFPSPDDIRTRLHYQYVEGLYERGGTRQNRAEARAIIEEIRQRLQDPGLAQRSIGVVTFNTNQQSLIEDMLNDLFAAHPELEKIANASEEPIFIKNLENVQGDERDVILFSVGYGQDKDGKIALNFGPLNREGGWRRLNVAVSRARYEMKVFSTLRSDQIDLRRTDAEGVAGLKAFLAYAEKGRAVLRYSSAASAVGHDGFVEAVADSLRARGFEARTHIGSSGYRIDIGIVNPHNTEEYAVGIICDGYNHAASKSARDREIVQTGILKRLGWKIVRLWCMDWWNDEKATLDSLVSKIEAAITSGPDDSSETPPQIAVSAAEEIPPISQPDGVLIPYKVCELPQLSIAPDEMASHGRILQSYLRKVIETEAPISYNLLCKRVLRACNIARMGPRISACMNNMIRAIQPRCTSGSFITYWRNDQDPDSYPHIRVSNERDATDIPPRETCNAALRILEEQGAQPAESLVHEMARLFGYNRVGDIVNAAMQEGIALAKGKGLVEEVNEKIRVL